MCLLESVLFGELTSEGLMDGGGVARVFGGGENVVLVAIIGATVVVGKSGGRVVGT